MHFSVDCVSELCGLGIDFVGRVAANTGRREVDA
jgi:hypothetical protein